MGEYIAIKCSKASKGYMTEVSYVLFDYVWKFISFLR